MAHRSPPAVAPTSPVASTTPGPDYPTNPCTMQCMEATSRSHTCTCSCEGTNHGQLLVVYGYWWTHEYERSYQLHTHNSMRTSPM